MQSTLVKEQAKILIDKMPGNSTWDDLMREKYTRSVIEQGLADSKAGRSMDVREILAKYGLPE